MTWLWIATRKHRYPKHISPSSFGIRICKSASQELMSGNITVSLYYYKHRGVIWLMMRMDTWNCEGSLSDVCSYHNQPMAFRDFSKDFWLRIPGQHRVQWQNIQRSRCFCWGTICRLAFGICNPFIFKSSGLVFLIVDRLIVICSLLRWWLNTGRIQTCITFEIVQVTLLCCWPSLHNENESQPTSSRIMCLSLWLWTNHEKFFQSSKIYHPSDKSSISGMIWTCWKHYELRTKVTGRWRHASANLYTWWYLQACRTNKMPKSEAYCTDAGAILDLAEIYSTHRKENSWLGEKWAQPQSRGSLFSVRTMCLPWHSMICPHCRKFGKTYFWD